MLCWQYKIYLERLSLTVYHASPSFIGPLPSKAPPLISPDLSWYEVVKLPRPLKRWHPSHEVTTNISLQKENDGLIKVEQLYFKILRNIAVESDWKILINIRKLLQLFNGKMTTIFSSQACNTLPLLISNNSSQMYSWMSKEFNGFTMTISAKS